MSMLCFLFTFVPHAADRGVCWYGKQRMSPFCNLLKRACCVKGWEGRIRAGLRDIRPANPNEASDIGPDTMHAATEIDANTDIDTHCGKDTDRA